MGFLARDTQAKACTSFRSRIEAFFTADGSFIEYVDCQCVSLLIFFYSNKKGCYSAVLCHLKERRKKFRIYRCHPVDLSYWQNADPCKMCPLRPEVKSTGLKWTLSMRQKSFMILLRVKCGGWRNVPWAGICKRLWSPRIDSEESISPAYVASQASTTNRVSYRPARLGIDSWSP